VVPLSTGRIAIVAFAAAPGVPLLALVIAGFASNQVEGFAVMKGSGFLLMAPLAAFFIPRPWDLLVGVLPTYWPVKAYFAAAAGSEGLFWTAAALSLVYPPACVIGLYRRFRRRAMAG